MTSGDEELLQLDAIDLLKSGGYDASPANVERLVPLLIQARHEAASDVERARVGEYDKITDLTKIPARTTPALDFVAAFEEYAATVSGSQIKLFIQINDLETSEFVSEMLGARARRTAIKPKPDPVAQGDDLALALVPSRPARTPIEPQSRKVLPLVHSLQLPGESCDVREILAAVAEEQDEGFKSMSAVLRDEQAPKVRQAVETLDALHRSFGDDENRPQRMLLSLPTRRLVVFIIPITGGR